MRVFLKIGDVFVSRMPVVFETVLGSCVSVCIWDEENHVGGMNHYMLPRYKEGIKNPLYCGRESLDVLIKGFMKGGSRTSRLKAKVFGGCKVIGISKGVEIGNENVNIAIELLGEYGIPVIRRYTGINSGMKVFFYPLTGIAFVRPIPLVIQK